MEEQYAPETSGSEVAQEDLLVMAQQAALMDDKVLAELLRLRPLEGSTVTKAILPYAVAGPGNIGFGDFANQPNEGVVQPTGAGDGSVWVNPFRAVIGTRSQPTGGAPAARKNWNDTRSAISIGTVGAAGNRVKVQLAATATNHRWDLIYARVDVDVVSLTENRSVRDSNGVASSSLPIRRNCVVTILKVQGVEGTSPSRPSLPSDSGNSYYIPLAYVRIVHPFTLSSTIVAKQIMEVAPTLPISRAMGVASLAPADSQYREDRIVNSNAALWTGAIRPDAHLPSTMVGGDSRIIALSYGTGRVHTLGAIDDIDDSIDWRNRLFRWQLSVGTANFAWRAVSYPGMSPSGSNAAATSQLSGMGQSFLTDVSISTPAVPNAAFVMLVDHASVPLIASSAYVALFVDLATGKLQVVASATDPGVKLVVWMDASAPFGAP